MSRRYQATSSACVSASAISFARLSFLLARSEGLPLAGGALAVWSSATFCNLTTSRPLVLRRVE